MRRSDRALHLLLALGALVALTTTLPGCGLLQRFRGAEEAPLPPAAEGDKAADEVVAGAEEPARMAPAPMEASAGGGGETGPALDIMAAAQAAVDRKVIKTADLNIEVKDIAAAQKQVQDLTEAAGGFIADMNVEHHETRTEATIVARVPSANFRQVYEQVKQLGDVKRDHVGGQDVTEEYMDLEARIANKRVEEQRLRELFARAGKISDLLEVERELSRVRGEIESLQGRLRYLKDQVSFSTITISLCMLGEASVNKPQGWRLGYHIVGAFRGLLSAVQWLITALIYVLIAGAVVWVPLLLIILAIRNSLRRRQAQRSTLPPGQQ